MYSSFLPKRGGVERHMYDLCECLIQRGHKPIVLTWIPSMPPYEIIAGIKVHRIRIPSLLRFMRYPMILFLSLYMTHLVRRYKIDIIHAHDYLPGLAAVLTGIFIIKPVVVTFHLPIQNTTFYTPSRISPLILIEKVLKKCFIFGVSRIICVSNFTHKETLSLGFPVSKLKIIYNWTMSSPMQNKPLKDPLKKFNLERKRYILSIGRLEEKQKGFSMLIHAFKLLIDKGYELDLVIVGDGPDKKAYTRYLNKIGIKNRVYLLSNISDLNLAHLYRACDMFVLPSRLEGLPLVLLEAMSYGKPIVATKVGGIPEVIEDGYNGILVDPDTNGIALGIETLLLSPYLKSILAKRSQEMVSKKFSKYNCHVTIDLLKTLARARANRQ